MDDVVLHVSDFVALVNQTLEYAYPKVVIEGEVSGFNISKNKWVFFDLKDDESTLNCFMSVYQMKTPIEDGMKLRVSAQPKLTPWGRFSVTVQTYQPAGEGSLKRAFQLLKAKLAKEGLFEPGRKRSLPQFPSRIGVISSAQSAGYADFLKIVNNRWGGVSIELADVQVQGEVAPDQIVSALNHFTQESSPVDVLVIIRGGGSADDLMAFNTEPVVRAIAASRIPTLVGVGHETDTTLADLVSDVRSATPSNAAEIVVPSKSDVAEYVDSRLQSIGSAFNRRLQDYRHQLNQTVHGLASALLQPKHKLDVLSQKLQAYNPRSVLEKGYAIVSSARGVVKSQSDVKSGEKLVIELSKDSIGAKVD